MKKLKKYLASFMIVMGLFMSGVCLQAASTTEYASDGSMNVTSTRYPSYSLGVVSNKSGYTGYYGSVTVEVRSNDSKGTVTKTTNSSIGGSYVNGYPKATYSTASARAIGTVAGNTIKTIWH